MSRVALLSTGGLLEKASPVAFLDFRLAAATRDIIHLAARSDPLFGSSSAWSGVSSWLGLFGDFGIVGLLVYLGLSVYVWRQVRRRKSWGASAAQAVLLTAAMLGAMFSWLEEPGFTLVVALIAGLVLTEDTHAHPAHP